MTFTPLKPALPGTMTVLPDYAALCDLVAERIAALVRTKPDAVLGFATGSTPLGVYDRLVRHHQDEGLDFSQVTCFNLDEYYPMPSEAPHSYHVFMHDNLFRHLNCRRWFVPDGRPGSDAQVARRCRDYEAQIADAEGIDLQLLGIGRNGHIGFNEPGSARGSRTRLVTLAPMTREDAAESLGGIENVPLQAVTVGIGTISEAREIVLMATGRAKAEIVRDAWRRGVTDHLPASWVRLHPNAHLCVDESAASLL